MLRRLARAARWVGGVAAALVVVALVALAGAQLLLNSARGRELVSSLASDALGLEVTLDALELHLLAGLDLEGLRVVETEHFPEAPLVELARLRLRWDPADLLGRTVHVKDLTLEGLRVDVRMVDGRSNLPGGAAKTGEDAEPDAEPAPPPSLALPPLPVAVALDQLRLEGGAVRFRQDERLRADLRELALDGSGWLRDGAGLVELGLTAGETEGDGLELHLSGAAPEPVALESGLGAVLRLGLKDASELWARADLELPGATLDLGEGPRPATVGLALRAGLLPEVEGGTVQLKSLDVELGPAGRLALSGRVRDPLGTPRVDAYVHEGELRLAELVAIAAPFLPPVEARGTVRFDELKAEGGLDGGRDDAPFVVAGGIALDGVGATLPEAGVSASGLDGALELELVKLVGFFPVDVRATGELRMASATIPDGGALRDTRLEIRSGNDRPHRHRLDVELASRVTPPGLADAPTLPVTARLGAVADTREERIEDLALEARVGEALEARATGTAERLGRGAVRLDATASADLARLLALVPDALLGGLERPTLGGRVELAATTRADIEARTASVEASLRPRDVRAEGLPQGARLGELGGAIELEAKLGPDFAPGAFAVDGALELAGLAARDDEVEIGSLRLDLDASGESLPPRELAARLDATARDLAFTRAEQGATLGVAELGLRLEGDPLAGDLTVPELALTIDERTVLARATARVEGFGREHLEGSFDVDGLHPERILALARGIVGAELLEGLELGGLPTLHARVEGRLPTREDVAALKLPVEASVTVHLEESAIAWPQRELTGARVSGDVAVELWPERIDVTADLGAFDLRHAKALGGEPLDVAVNVEAKLLDLDRLVLPRLQASILNRGAFAFAKGEVAGFGQLLASGDEITPAALMEQVAAELETVLGLSSPEPTVVGELELEGATSMRLSTHVRPGRDLTVDGELFFEDLGVRVGDRVVATGLDGRLPLAKTLALGDAPAPSVARPERRPFYESFRPLSPSRDNLTLERFESGEIDIRDLYMDVAFLERSLRLDRFGLGIFGGWAAGRLETAFLPAKNRISVATEFGEVSLKGLLPGDVDLSDREAQVAGNVRLDLDLARSSATGRAPGLEDVNADINLTRIGGDALDELLRSMDPKGTNSSIATFRTILKTTDLAIDEVQIPIRNGYLTVIVDYSLNAHLPKIVARFLDLFYEDLTHSRFEIPNISLLNLANSQRFAGQLEKLGALEPLLDVVGGERIVAAPDGSILFR